MAGLVPAIHVFELAVFQDVDARHKAGHDGFDQTYPRARARWRSDFRSPSCADLIRASIFSS
jgi:hypothetical protein